MNALERYTVLMSRQDTDPRHWRAVWLKDTSARLIYLHDPLIKVAQDLVKAVARLDADALTAFLERLNERVITIASQHPEYPLGSEAAALKAMVGLTIFPTIKQALPAIALAGLITELVDDLDEAAIVFCAHCETRLESIHLTETEPIHLCPLCDHDDLRWFQDVGCLGEDVRARIQEELRSALGDGESV
jgi:hypothetical protein